MLGIYMVNWSGQPIPPAEMLVMRRVAIEMRVIHGVKEVGFSHDLCAGIVRFEKTGVYGAVDGLYFFGDLGSKNDQPNNAVFFIPHTALRLRERPGMIVANTLRFVGDRYVLEGYPEDIDEATVSGAGKISVTVRREV